MKGLYRGGGDPYVVGKEPFCGGGGKVCVVDFFKIFKGLEFLTADLIEKGVEGVCLVAWAVIICRQLFEGGIFAIDRLFKVLFAKLFDFCKSFYLYDLRAGEAVRRKAV